MRRQRPTSRRIWPTAISWTRPFVASIPGHRAVVALHYLLGMPLPRWRRPWASPSVRPSPGCTTRSPRCACPPRPKPTRPRAGPRRAGRMTTEARFERQLPAHPRGPLPGAVSRLSRRGPGRRDPHATAPGLDLPRKVAPHGHHNTPSLWSAAVASRLGVALSRCAARRRGLRGLRRFAPDERFRRHSALPEWARGVLERRRHLHRWIRERACATAIVTGPEVDSQPEYSPRRDEALVRPAERLELLHSTTSS